MVDQSLESAIAELWRIPRPGPDNLISSPAFISLKELCEVQFGGGKTVIGLSYALQSLGLPCRLPAAKADIGLDPIAAAQELKRAFTRKTTVRRHICPLDLAEELPALTFGRSRVAQLSESELEALFDAPRLARNFPNTPFESNRLAQFHWLVVEEEVELTQRPEARAMPFMVMDMGRDLGEIEPHLGRFPPAVEAVLFFLLLAPWEEWATMREVDWRGFRIPWIYTTDEDLFVRPAQPPTADSLSLEPWFAEDAWGDVVELEQPTTLPLSDDAQQSLLLFTDEAWSELSQARTTPLFETPIAHFLVRAFLADGMDEVMAHMTTIEAALGSEGDHRRNRRLKPDPHPSLSATNRIAARIGAALGEGKAARDYKDLFELRSAFVHGRAGLQRISTQQRVLARSLARRTVSALIPLAPTTHRTREEVLNELLKKGAAYL